MNGDYYKLNNKKWWEKTTISKSATHTFREEHMSCFVFDAVTNGEVIDQGMDRILQGSDEVDAIHCAKRFSLLVDVFHHCQIELLFIQRFIQHKNQQLWDM